MFLTKFLNIINIILGFLIKYSHYFCEMQIIIKCIESSILQDLISLL